MYNPTYLKAILLTFTENPRINGNKYETGYRKGEIK